MWNRWPFKHLLNDSKRYLFFLFVKKSWLWFMLSNSFVSLYVRQLQPHNANISSLSQLLSMIHSPSPILLRQKCHSHTIKYNFLDPTSRKSVKTSTSFPSWNNFPLSSRTILQTPLTCNSDTLDWKLVFVQLILKNKQLENIIVYLYVCPRD